jgi:hypothetical protein
MQKHMHGLSSFAAIIDFFYNELRVPEVQESSNTPLRNVSGIQNASAVLLCAFPNVRANRWRADRASPNDLNA